MSYTVNGRTYRNLEEQVKRNQELSLEAGRDTDTIQEELAEIQSQLEQIPTYTPVYEAMNGGGITVPSVIWEGKKYNDGSFILYTNIPVSYNTPGTVSQISINSNVLGVPAAIKLPANITAAIEVQYSIHPITSQTSVTSISGFDLSSSPYLSTIGLIANGTFPQGSNQFNISVLVTGRSQ